MDRDYSECAERNVPDSARMFLMLKYTDLTQKHLYPNLNGYGDNGERKVWSSAIPSTVPGSRDVLLVHCACPSFSLQAYEAYSRCNCTCKVLGTLRTTATLVRVFM